MTTPWARLAVRNFAILVHVEMCSCWASYGEEREGEGLEMVVVDVDFGAVVKVHADLAAAEKEKEAS